MTRSPLPRPQRLLAVALAAALLPAAAGHAQETTATSAATAPAADRRGPRPDVRPPAQLAVSPGRFEIDMNEGPSVHAVRLMNFGDREVAVRVAVVPWELDEQNRVVTLPPAEDTLDQAMIFNPSSFVVAPRSEQTVRFSIRPRTRPETGEHRAMIYFEEQPRGDQAAGLQVLFRVGVAVYAYAGEVQRAGELRELRIASSPKILSAAFDIASAGNAHVRLQGQYAVWPVDRFPGLEGLEPFEGLDRPDFRVPEPALMAGALPAIPVLAGTERQVFMANEHSLPPGQYILTALGTLGDLPIRRAMEFVVPAAPADVAVGRQDPAAGR